MTEHRRSPLPRPRRGPATARRRSRRELLRLGAGAAAALLLTSCGGGVRVFPLGGGSGGAAELAEWPFPPAAPRAGRLRLGVVGHRGRGDAALPDQALPLVYSCLIAVDPRDGTVYGDLARSVEVDGEALTVRFRMRPGLHFHPNADGLAAALTAEDVRRDFTRRRDAGEFLFAEVVRSVEAPTLEEVVLRLRAPFSLLFEYLADASRAGVGHEASYVSHAAPLGSGPFLPVTRDAGGDLLIASRLYHRAPLPRIESVALLRVGDEAELADAFALGQIDVLPGAGGRGAAPGSTGARRLARPSRKLRGLGLSILPEKGGVKVKWVEAFQDVRVRSAVSHALDRAVLAAAGDGEPSGPVGPAWAADALPQQTLARHPLLVYDPTAARSLLEEAGHAGLSFRLDAPAIEGMGELAQLLVAQLENVGFQPQLVLREPAEWHRSFEAGDFEATLFEFGELATPEVGLRLHTSGGAEGRFSPWGYSSPLYDAAVRRVLGEITPEARARQAREAQRLLLEQVPAMFPLFAPRERVDLAAGIDGYAWDGYEFNAGHLAPLWSVAAAPAAGPSGPVLAVRAAAT